MNVEQATKVHEFIKQPELSSREVLHFAAHLLGRDTASYESLDVVTCTRKARILACEVYDTLNSAASKHLRIRPDTARLLVGSRRSTVELWSLALPGVVFYEGGSVQGDQFVRDHILQHASAVLATQVPGLKVEELQPGETPQPFTAESRQQTERVEREGSYADLKRQLSEALAAAAEASNGFAEAQGNTAYYQEEHEDLVKQVAAAATQFRAITSDFPGLTGPLVDLFKEVPV